MDESEKRRTRSRVIGASVVVLGVVIAVSGGAAILALRAPKSASFLVSPDLPLMPGDSVSLRRGTTGCATSVLDLVPNGAVVVAGCSGGPPLEVSRGALSIEAYVPGVSSPALGDVVIIRRGAEFGRAIVVGREPAHRIRIRPEPPGGEPSVIEERTAFLVRRSGGS